MAKKEQYLLKNNGLRQKYSNGDKNEQYLLEILGCNKNIQAMTKKEQYLVKNIGMQHLFILLWPRRALNLDQQQLPNSFHRIHAP